MYIWFPTVYMWLLSNSSYLWSWGSTFTRFTRFSCFTLIKEHISWVLERIVYTIWPISLLVLVTNTYFNFKKIYILLLHCSNIFVESINIYKQYYVIWVIYYGLTMTYTFLKNLDNKIYFLFEYILDIEIWCLHHHQAFQRGQEDHGDP